MSEMCFSSRQDSVCKTCHTESEKARLKAGESVLPTNGQDFFDWVDSRNFVLYLLHNKHICSFSVAAIPHDGTHGVCASCQANDIIRIIQQNREEFISAYINSQSKLL